MNSKILTREYIQRNGEDLVPKEYTRFPLIDRLLLLRSWQPTGEYFRCYWDRNDEAAAQAEAWKVRKTLANLDETARCVRFHGNLYRGNKIFPPEDECLLDEGRTLSLSLQALSLEQLRKDWKRIFDFNPQWMQLLPSVAQLLAEIIKKENLSVPTGLKYIELTGEPITNASKVAVRDVFGFEPGVLFSLPELGPIAIGRTLDSLQVLEENVQLTVAEDRELIAAGVKNEAMPLRKYQLGIYGSLTREDNGVQFLAVDASDQDLLIELPDGTKRPCEALAAALEYTVEFMGLPVSQFRFLQTAKDRITAEFTLKPAFVGWKNTIQREFLENLQDPMLQKMQWDFRFLEHGTQPCRAGYYCTGIGRK